MSPRKGYCLCGCGKKTAIATRNHARQGEVIGQPKRYIFGHTGVGRREGKRAKRCGTCRLMKPLDKFFKASANRIDGLQASCKECQRKSRRKYKHDPEGERQRTRESRQRNGPYPKERSRAKYLARKKLAYHIERGYIVRPAKCEKCNQPPAGRGCIQAHHKDYSRPLDVEWLCPKCHKSVHSPYSRKTK